MRTRNEMTAPLDSFEAGELLASLVDKSLVVFDEADGRYRLLETVRQYARDRLFETGEAETWRDRHLAHFLALGEEAEPQLTGGDQQAWLDRLETEHDNLRAALESSSASCDPEAGLRLAGAIWRFWYVRGHLSEGRGWLGGLLAVDASGQTFAVRAKALTGAGNLATTQSDHAAARAFHEESLALRRTIGDRVGIATSLNNLGNVATKNGDHEGARVLYEESLALRRELGDRWGIAMSLDNLGIVASNQGDCAGARALHEESLALRRELGDRGGIAMTLNNLGSVAIEQGEYAEARALHEESLALRRELGDRWGIAMSLNNLGNVACEQGDNAGAMALHEKSLAIYRELGDQGGIASSLEGIAAGAAAVAASARAVHLWGAAERLREEIGSRMMSADRGPYERQVAAARAGVGDDAAFDRAWQEGRALALERAIELAVQEPDS